MSLLQQLAYAQATRLCVIRDLGFEASAREIREAELQLRRAVEKVAASDLKPTEDWMPWEGLVYKFLLTADEFEAAPAELRRTLRQAYGAAETIIPDRGLDRAVARLVTALEAWSELNIRQRSDFDVPIDPPEPPPEPPPPPKHKPKPRSRRKPVQDLRHRRGKGRGGGKFDKVRIQSNHNRAMRRSAQRHDQWRAEAAQRDEAKGVAELLAESLGTTLDELRKRARRGRPNASERERIAKRDQVIAELVRQGHPNKRIVKVMDVQPAVISRISNCNETWHVQG